MIKICGICKEEFTLEHPNQKYCCGDCRIKARRGSLIKFNAKRRGRLDHREYMAQYMYKWRRRYRAESYKKGKESLGTGTGGPHPDILEDKGVLDFSKEIELMKKLKKRSLGKNLNCRLTAKGEEV